ncbi:MAG: Sir2 family NAD-dependent protein deacetylase [Miltoncostaeaceae bacterium]
MSERSTAEIVAEAIRESSMTVVLTGLFLGARESEDLTHGRGQWRERASLEAFLTEPQRFWEYYVPAAKVIGEREPNPGHGALARMQERGNIDALVTQAVDRLHARAGSRDVVEVYGSVLVHRCQRCDERYGLVELDRFVSASDDGIPRCDTPDCGYPLRPEGTLWGEPLIEEAVKEAWELAARAELMIIFDSDLQTAPISLLPSVPLTRGTDLIIVGSDPTQYDRYAKLVVREERSTDVIVDVDGLLAGSS